MFFGKRFLKFWGGSILVRSFFETFWELGTHPVLLDTHTTETVGELPPKPFRVSARFPRGSNHLKVIKTLGQRSQAILGYHKVPERSELFTSFGNVSRTFSKPS